MRLATVQAVEAVDGRIAAGRIGVDEALPGDSRPGEIGEALRQALGSQLPDFLTPASPRKAQASSQQTSQRSCCQEV